MESERSGGSVNWLRKKKSDDWKRISSHEVSTTMRVDEEVSGRRRRTGDNAQRSGEKTRAGWG